MKRRGNSFFYKFKSVLCRVSTLENSLKLNWKWSRRIVCKRYIYCQNMFLQFWLTQIELSREGTSKSDVTFLGVGDDKKNRNSRTYVDGNISIKIRINATVLSRCSTRGRILTPESRCQFHQHFTQSFYACRFQKCKKILMTWLNFYAFKIWVHKSWV